MVSFAIFLNIHEEEHDADNEVADDFTTEEGEGLEDTAGNGVASSQGVETDDDGVGDAGHGNHDGAVDGHGEAVSSLAVDRFLMIEDVGHKGEGDIHRWDGA